MAYSCNFSTPWEGYTLGINGTEGRLEVTHHSNPDPTGKTSAAADKGEIVFFPLFGGKEVIEPPVVAGGHGGADFKIQEDLFDKPSKETIELALVAGHSRRRQRGRHRRGSMEIHKDKKARRDQGSHIAHWKLQPLSAPTYAEAKVQS